MPPTTRVRLGRQAWVRGVGPSQPDADAIALAAADAGSTKPRSALWTSTWHPGRGSDWIAWCVREEWGARPFDVWLLDPHPKARIWVVDSPRDADQLHGEHPAHDGAIDWRGVRDACDAVHLTRRAVARGHPWAATWRCESTAWLRWSFLRTEHIGVWSPGATRRPYESRRGGRASTWR